jgi:hypothetical protein
VPVHRHLHDKRGSEHALSSELDAWRQSRNLRLEEEEKVATESPTEVAEVQPAAIPMRRWLVLGSGVAVLALLALPYIVVRNRAGLRTRPKSNRWRCCHSAEIHHRIISPMG